MKKGFTLAEVLITLGIIGVVAALTIPTLINNYQKQSYVTAFKKGYAQVQNAFKLMMVDEGVNYMSQTQMWKNIERDTSGSSENYVKYVASNLGKHIKISNSCSGSNCFPDLKYNQLNGVEIGAIYSNGFSVVQLSDGMILAFFFSPPYTLTEQQCLQVKKDGGSMCSMFSPIYLDINGIQPPNTMGRDVFMFIIDDNGAMVPYGSKSVAVFPSNGSVTSDIPYWKDAPSTCDPKVETDKSGAGCAERIIEEGWKMNY